MKISIKALKEGIKIPSKAHSTDIGFDLIATSKRNDEYGNVVYGTSLAIELPPGFMGGIYPRSSISKMPISLANAVGVIDPGYRGEIMLKFKPTPYFSLEQGDEPVYEYEVGDRIGQLIIHAIPNVELELSTELSTSSRGEGGFGSTDKQFD